MQPKSIKLNLPRSISYGYAEITGYNSGAEQVSKLAKHITKCYNITIFIIAALTNVHLYRKA